MSDKSQQEFEITNFLDYRDFLAEVLERKKRQSKKFTYEYWAKRIPSSKSYLKLVTDKKRHSSQERVWKLAQILELSEFEKRYILFLFLQNTAIDEKIAAYYDEILMALKDRAILKSRTEIFRPLKEQHDVSIEPYKSWLHLALSAMIRLQDFRPDIDWMAAKLGSQDRQRVGRAWAELLESGYIFLDKGRYTKIEKEAEAPMTDPDDHTMVRSILSRAWEVCGQATRYRSFAFQSYNFALDRNGAHALIDLFQEVHRRLVEIEEAAKNPDEVYFISNNIFNVTPRQD